MLPESIFQTSTNKLAAGTKRDVIIVDNRDSFTYNLVEEFRVLGANLCIVRNDIATPALQTMLLAAREPMLVLSPGPGTPDQAGHCLNYLQDFLQQQKGFSRSALLGICLGHQALIQATGGAVVRAPQPMHGERSLLRHEADPVFCGLPAQFSVARYHSLIGAQLPACLHNIASSEGLCMAVRHRELPALGFQFHPESILTTHGRALLSNVLQQLKAGECDARAA